MHKNFSNQWERDTALDSPADLGAVLARQLTEASRDAAARGRKMRRKRMRKPEGMLGGEGGVWRTPRTRGAGSHPHSPPGYSLLQPLCVQQL